VDDDGDDDDDANSGKGDAVDDDAAALWAALCPPGGRGALRRLMTRRLVGLVSHCISSVGWLRSKSAIAAAIAL